MKPSARFLIHALGPPQVCAVLLFTIHFFATWKDGHPLILVSLIGYSYLFAGIPSMLHAALMECCYRWISGAHSRMPILVAVADGTIAGTAVALMMGWHLEEGVFSIGAMLISCGALTGLLAGLFVFARSRA